jgi:hypothetical protein
MAAIRRLPTRQAAGAPAFVLAEIGRVPAPMGAGELLAAPPTVDFFACL